MSSDGTGDCSGAADCTAPVHVHGCWADGPGVRCSHPGHHPVGVSEGRDLLIRQIAGEVNGNEELDPLGKGIHSDWLWRASVILGALERLGFEVIPASTLEAGRQWQSEACEWMDWLGRPHRQGDDPVAFQGKRVDLLARARRGVSDV
jgi:hypothetical protein